jgi:hypothetical protein
VPSLRRRASYIKEGVLAMSRLAIGIATVIAAAHRAIQPAYHAEHPGQVDAGRDQRCDHRYSEPRLFSRAIWDAWRARRRDGREAASKDPKHRAASHDHPRPGQAKRETACDDGDGYGDEQDGDARDAKPGSLQQVASFLAILVTRGVRIADHVGEPRLCGEVLPGLRRSSHQGIVGMRRERNLARVGFRR